MPLSQILNDQSVLAEGNEFVAFAIRRVLNPGLQAAPDAQRGDPPPFSNCKWYTLSEPPCRKYSSARSACMARSLESWVFVFCAAALCCITAPLNEVIPHFIFSVEEGI